jgi:hypothetical protein
MALQMPWAAQNSSIDQAFLGTDDSLSSLLVDRADFSFVSTVDGAGIGVTSDAQLYSPINDP